MVPRPHLTERMSPMIKKLDKAISKISKFADQISQYLLIVLVIILVANMISRPIYKPFVWVYDLACLLPVAIISLCLPFCFIQGGLIEIDLLTQKFPKPVRVVLAVVMDLVSLGVIGFVNWCEWKYMVRIISQGITSTTVHIPYWPFAVCMFIGFCLFFLALLMDFIKKITGGKE